MSRVENNRTPHEADFKCCTLISSFPPELVHRICKAHISELERDDASFSISKFGVHRALNLSHVCSQWHAIVLNSKRFWADIYVNDAGKFDKTFLDACLQRSRDTPLHIFFQDKANNSDQPGDDLIRNVQSILSRLLSRAERWRSIRIKIMSTETSLPFLRKRISDLSIPPTMLESASLEITTISGGIHSGKNAVIAAHMEIWKFLHSSGRPLRSVGLGDSIIINHISKHPIVYGSSETTELVLSAPFRLDGLLRALTHLKNLEYLCVEGIALFAIGFSMQPKYSGIVALPHLRHLSIKICTINGVFKKLLGYIKFPKLEVLNLESTKENVPCITPQDLDLALERGGCKPLKRFEMYETWGVPYNQERIDQFMRSSYLHEAEELRFYSPVGGFTKLKDEHGRFAGPVSST